jgi:hypothetical protein
MGWDKKNKKMSFDFFFSFYKLSACTTYPNTQDLSDTLVYTNGGEKWLLIPTKNAVYKCNII